MRAALIAVGAVVAVGAIVSASLLSWGAATPAAQASSAPAASPPAASPPASASPSASASSSSRARDTPTTGTAGPSPEQTPTSGREAPPPAAPPDHTLPPVTQAPPLVSAPLPASGTKSGGLIAGFPRRIMGPAAGTTVVSSSIATEGSTMQAALVGRSTASAADIRAHYALLWASLGLVYQQTTDGTTAFRGPYDSLTLSFVSSGTGIHYTVFGVFRTR